MSVNTLFSSINELLSISKYNLRINFHNYKQIEPIKVLRSFLKHHFLITSPTFTKIWLRSKARQWYSWKYSDRFVFFKDWAYLRQPLNDTSSGTANLLPQTLTPVGLQYDFTNGIERMTVLHNRGNNYFEKFSISKLSITFDKINRSLVSGKWAQ